MDSTNKISFVSLEDQPVIAERLERMCKDIVGSRFGGFVHVTSVQDGIDEITKNEPDVLFLDLDLGDEHGFDLLSQMTSFSAHTIIVSAHENEAIRAFEYGVLDFVPKPFSKARLASALARFEAPQSTAQAARMLSFRSHGRIELQPVSDVVFVKGADKYSEVQFRDGSSRLHDKNLHRLEQILPPEFIRVHKSYIVALREVQSLRTSSESGYSLDLKAGGNIPVGRTRYPKVRALLD